MRRRGLSPDRLAQVKAYTEPHGSDVWAPAAWWYEPPRLRQPALRAGRDVPSGRRVPPASSA